MLVDSGCNAVDWLRDVAGQYFADKCSGRGQFLSSTLRFSSLSLFLCFEL
jgi:hypothetical protein